MKKCLFVPNCPLLALVNIIRICKHFSNLPLILNGAAEKLKLLHK